MFLYEAAASRPDRAILADVRRGEFEGLRELIGKDPKKKPDFGPERIHPTAGAIAVGARRFLVAFNANLNTPDVRVAKAIAASIREQSGGLKNVRALGFSIEGGRRAQVSMNLVNTEATPIHRVLALVREEAARHGAAISGCEVVGLVPEYAMLDAAEHYLQLEGFKRDQVLELRLKTPPLTEAASVAVVLRLGRLADAHAGRRHGLGLRRGAGRDPADHGGRAHAGQEEVRRARGGHEGGAAQGRGAARAAAGPGAQGQRGVRGGAAGPQAAAGHARPRVEAREKAMAAADLEAMRVPLETAQACLEVLELAVEVAEKGNVNAASDSGVAGLLAHAAAEGALLNVEINLKSAADSADKNRYRDGSATRPDDAGARWPGAVRMPCMPP